jgi:CheY-like chemotaxis protein/HPt (histidine-containing phosphotransfer) domain-containing protein
MPYGRVLVVDDVQTNLYVAKGLMVPYGLHIDTATRGADAIEMIKQGNVYDVIFMDHMMPEMDGIEAVKHIRKLGYRQPIIALTANAMVGQAEMFMENGFDGFLSKPIDIRQLNASLNNLIRDKQTQEVIEAAHRQHITDKNTSKLSNTQIDIQLAKSAVRDTEKAVDILGDVLGRLDSCGDEDFDAFVAQTHALNGVMANIDENRLSKTAARLEAAGKNRDITVISRDTPAFLEKLKAVIKKITPEEEEEEEVSGVNAGEDIAHLREKLSAILLACNAYDIITADSILVEVKQQNWPQQTVKILDSVTDHLLHSEFDEAAELVTEYLDNDMIIGK